MVLIKSHVLIILIGLLSESNFWWKHIFVQMSRVRFPTRLHSWTFTIYFVYCPLENVVHGYNLNCMFYDDDSQVYVSISPNHQNNDPPDTLQHECIFSWNSENIPKWYSVVADWLYKEQIWICLKRVNEIYSYFGLFDDGCKLYFWSQTVPSRSARRTV